MSNLCNNGIELQHANSEILISVLSDPKFFSVFCPEEQWLKTVEFENVGYVDNTISAGFVSDARPPIESYEKLVSLGFSVIAYYFEPSNGFVGKWQNGINTVFDITECDSDNVRSVIGEELDDYFNVSQFMAEAEDNEM